MDGAGSVRRDVTCCQGNSPQQRRDHNKRCGVCGFDFEEQACHYSRKRYCAGNANDNAKARKFSSVAHYQLQYVSLPSPESYVDADLMSTLADAISHSAINSHSRKNERENRESSEKEHIESLLCHRPGHQVLHGLSVADRNLTIQAPNLLLDCSF